MSAYSDSLCVLQVFLYRDLYTLDCWTTMGVVHGAGAVHQWCHYSIGGIMEDGSITHFIVELVTGSSVWMVFGNRNISAALALMVENGYQVEDLVVVPNMGCQILPEWWDQPACGLR